MNIYHQRRTHVISHWYRISKDHWKLSQRSSQAVYGRGINLYLYKQQHPFFSRHLVFAQLQIVLTYYQCYFKIKMFFFYSASLNTSVVPVPRNPTCSQSNTTVATSGSGTTRFRAEERGRQNERNSHKSNRQYFICTNTFTINGYDIK